MKSLGRDLRAELHTRLRDNPVVAILGPRQCGKTTLARQLYAEARGDKVFFDLEDPDHVARLAEPMLALGERRGLVVLDEIQRAPRLFEVLRVLVDRPRAPRFLILGSAAFELVRGISETLAGRIAFCDLGGLSLGEVGPGQLARLWERGGFPRSLLARSRAASVAWRRDFVRTFLERDLPALGVAPSPEAMRRLWTMVAHYHGQTWNASEFGRALGVGDHTARRHLDVLVGTYVVRALAPFAENVGKRVVKAPKVYVRDSGLLHTLLGLEDPTVLADHPKVGASWEGFALEQTLAALGARPQEVFFWATHGGAELDLLWVRGQRRRGFEFKRTSAPTATRSMHVAMTDLRLDRLDVVYPGTESYPIAPKMRAVPLATLVAETR